MWKSHLAYRFRCGYGKVSKKSAISHPQLCQNETKTINYREGLFRPLRWCCLHQGARVLIFGLCCFSHVFASARSEIRFKRRWKLFWLYFVFGEFSDFHRSLLDISIVSSVAPELFVPFPTGATQSYRTNQQVQFETIGNHPLPCLAPTTTGDESTITHSSYHLTTAKMTWWP